VSKRTLGVRQAIQIVFQNPDASLNPRHTVGQILDYALRLFFGHLTPDERRARAIERLEQVRLSEHYLYRFPRQLSGGEKQRVAIARAFAAEPRLVLCDEVVSALDVSVQAAVLDLLAELQGKHGVAYLFISHDLAVVRSIADRVAVLYQGHLCEIGPVQHVFNDPSHPYTRLLLSAVLEPVPGRRSPVSDAAPGDGEPAMRGCAFQRACPRRLGSICDEESPPWRAAAPGHAIRCHIPLEDLSQSHPSPHIDRVAA
jgi:peptide/nickel transport system ATP-binding protein